MRTRSASFGRCRDLLLNEGHRSERHRASDAATTDGCPHRHARVFAVAGARHVAGIDGERCLRNGKHVVGVEPRCCGSSNSRCNHHVDDCRRGGCPRDRCGSDTIDDGGASRTAGSTDDNDNGASAGGHCANGCSVRCRIHGLRPIPRVAQRLHRVRFIGHVSRRLSDLPGRLGFRGRSCRPARPCRHPSEPSIAF